MNNIKMLNIELYSELDKDYNILLPYLYEIKEQGMEELKEVLEKIQGLSIQESLILLEGNLV